MVEAAVARVRAVTSHVEFAGDYLEVTTDDLDARDLVQLVSAEPYSINGEYVFLPFFYEQEYSLALHWNGSLGASRLEQFSGPTSFERHLELRRERGHARLNVVGTDPDIVAFFGGVPLGRETWIQYPQLLFLARRSNPAEERQIVLFREHADVIFFAKNRLLAPVTAQDPWTRTALEAAKLRRNPFSLMLIDRAAGERRDTIEALPSNVRRTVGYLADILAIAAEGPKDALVVHADQMREHFSSPAVTIVEAIAMRKEKPQALYERVRAMLGR